jgi:2,4-dienoyl-CoA reductase (NADPH2)
VKEKVGVPVFASNRLGNPFLAERTLRSGAADMICWGRPLIADPELPNKVREGRLCEKEDCLGGWIAVACMTPGQSPSSRASNAR